jgi:hypothetical protein
MTHGPSESEPLHVRMMTDDVSGIGLWDQTVTHDEEELPLPDEVRRELRQWVDEYTGTIDGENAHWTMDDLYAHDRCGYALSQEVQAALGPKYRIEYVCETGRLQQELDALGPDDPED